MAGIRLSVADVLAWNADAVREVFHVGQNLAAGTADVAQGLADLKAFDTWGGDAAEAAKTSIALTRQDLDAYGAEVSTVAHAARTAADAIEELQGKLRAVLAKVEDFGLAINAVTSSVEVTRQAVGGPAVGVINAIELQQEIATILGEAD